MVVDSEPNSEKKVSGKYGRDDETRTRDLWRDGEKEGRNLQKTSVTDGFFWRCKARSGTVIEPISNPRRLPFRPLASVFLNVRSSLPIPAKTGNRLCFVIVGCSSRFLWQPHREGLISVGVVEIDVFLAYHQNRSSEVARRWRRKCPPSRGPPGTTEGPPQDQTPLRFSGGQAILGRAMETSASCEARYAPLLYPTNHIGTGPDTKINFGGYGVNRDLAQLLP